MKTSNLMIYYLSLNSQRKWVVVGAESANHQQVGAGREDFAGA